MSVSKTLQEQVEFTRNVPTLINKAFELGYNVTLGDCFRDPRLHGAYGIKQGYGASRSFHKLKKAIDLNLFDSDGNYCAATEAHEALGAFWESLGGTWGGRFEDGNHYSWGEGQ
jgi:hypothetical protein